MVIVGIGILPAVEPLLSAGARAVTGYGRWILPHEFAQHLRIGDCAAHVNEFAAERQFDWNPSRTL